MGAMRLGTLVVVDSACSMLKASHITSLDVGRGHHFSGDYAQLAHAILAYSAVS
jgi:type IV secretory pathway VirJ component